MQKTLISVVAVTLTCLLAGCPPKPGETTAQVLLSGDASVGKALVKKLLGDKAAIDVSLIDAFFVTVTEISLDGNGGPTPLFSGSLEVNLLELTGLSQVITNAIVEPGTYTKIRLRVENPRMYLKAAPSVEITDIQLTANGQLFVSQTFEVPEGQTSLILIDFNGLHVVEQGNGGYTLTPQLRVDLSIVDANVAATGTVAANDTANKVLTLDLGSGQVNVDYAAAAIYRASDTDTATGTPADLAVGVAITAYGLLQADGSIVADSIQILPVE